MQTAYGRAKTMEMTEQNNNWIPILSGSAWALGLDVPAELIGKTADEAFVTVDPKLTQSFSPDDVLIAGSFGAGTVDERTVRTLMDLGIGAVVANDLDEAFAGHALQCGFRAVAATVSYLRSSTAARRTRSPAAWS